MYAGLVWSLALIALLVVRLVRSTPVLRRLVWPVLAAAAVYLGALTWDFVHSLDRGMLGNDPTDRILWLAEAVALIALALGVPLGLGAPRRTRAAVARLVVELAESPAPGGLRALLAQTLDDPCSSSPTRCETAGWSTRSGRAVTLQGEVTGSCAEATRSRCSSHRPGLLDDPGLVDEVAAAARLGARERALAGRGTGAARGSRALRAHA